MHQIVRFYGVLALSVFFRFPLMGGAGELPKSAVELFGLTNVWPIHLKFEGEQWRAMEPKGGGFPGFGGPGGPGPGRGPGPFPMGPGRPQLMTVGPGGPGPGGMPGPSMFLAPVFVRDGDRDGDGKLSREEFAGLGEKWFAAWDKSKSGKVSTENIAEGLSGSLMPPGFGGGRGPGGPGGGGGFRMNLQGAPGKRNGIASAMGVEFEYVRADMEFAGAKFTNVAARYKGNGTFLQSRGSNKRPLKVDLNRNAKGQKLAGRSTLNLHNGVTDPSYMNEALAFRLYRDAGVAAPRTAYARVNVTAGDEHKNEYFGLYILVENVDGAFLEERFGAKEGALFKPVTPFLFEYLGDDWNAYKQTYDPKDEPKKEEIARLLETCRLVTESSDEVFAAKLGDFIDVDQFARYMAVTVFLSDLDGILGPGQNFYLFLDPKDRKFRFVAWDQDHSFGQMRGSQEDRERLSIERPWQGENRFLERVFKVDAFRAAYRKHMANFHATIFKPENFYRQVEELAPFIEPHVKDESPQKLEAFQRAIAGEPSRFGGFGMGAGAKPIKGFVNLRWESIGEQLAGKSSGNIVGGEFGGRRGPGGPRNFGPGNFIASAFVKALDADKDSQLSRVEVSEGFAGLYEKWNSDKAATLTEEKLRAGIDRDLRPEFPRPPQ